MIEIGRLKTLHKGKENERITADVIRRITRKAYGHNSTWTRKLVVQLEGEDLITIWPVRTKARYSANVWDIYAWLVRSQVLSQRLAKARDRKAKRAEQRERRRLDYMEKKLKRNVEH